MYIDMGMKMRDVSVAEARSELPAIVRAAERGRPARITRRGKAVAAIVSIRELERLTAARPTFAEAYERWRRTVDPDVLESGPDFVPPRDRSTGRPVKL